MISDKKICHATIINIGFGEINQLRISDNWKYVIASTVKIAKTCENIYILTALPKLIFKKESLKFNIAAENKIKWVKKNFPEIPEKNIIIVHAIDKKKYAMENSMSHVLFDDSTKNVNAWKSSGGIGYLVTKKGFLKI